MIQYYFTVYMWVALGMDEYSSCCQWKVNEHIYFAAARFAKTTCTVAVLFLLGLLTLELVVS